MPKPDPPTPVRFQIKLVPDLTVTVEAHRAGDAVVLAGYITAFMRKQWEVEPQIKILP